MLEFFKKWWAGRSDWWANWPTSTLLKKRPVEDSFLVPVEEVSSSFPDSGMTISQVVFLRNMKSQSHFFRHAYFNSFSGMPYLEKRHYQVIFCSCHFVTQNSKEKISSSAFREYRGSFILSHCLICKREIQGSP